MSVTSKPVSRTTGAALLAGPPKPRARLSGPPLPPAAAPAAAPAAPVAPVAAAPARKGKAKPLSDKVRDPRDMTPEQLSIALKNIPMIETWIKAVKTYAFELLRDGEKIPGFVLGYGVKHRIWKPGEEQKIVKKLAQAGIDPAELYTLPELLSPAKMEELLKNRNMWPKKPRNEERPPTIIDEFIDYSMPEPAIKPASTDNTDRLADAEKEFK